MNRKIFYKMSKPLITVGITCFNAQETIQRAIEGALKQDWENIEVIIVDDASSDQSVDTIENLVKNDKRVKLYSQKENKGYPSALNTIVENASGDYIAFFDDDDDHETERLTEQYARLQDFKIENPAEDVFCYCHRRVFVDGVEKRGAMVRAIGSEPPEPYGKMVADFILSHQQKRGYSWGEFGSCTLMASKTSLQKFKFDPNFRRSAEWDFAVRAALNGAYFISVNKPLVIQHKTLTRDKSGKKPLIYSLMLKDKHKTYLKEKKIYWASKLQSYARFHYFRQNIWKSRLFFSLACIASPNRILIEKIRQSRSNTNKNALQQK